MDCNVRFQFYDHRNNGHGLIIVVFLMFNVVF